MIVEKIIDVSFGMFLKFLQILPTVPSFKPPAAFSDGLQDVFGFLGYFMPYSYYAPLITFILGLTAFRIVYAIYLVITKR